jgi:hypothetical protein
VAVREFRGAGSVQQRRDAPAGLLQLPELAMVDPVWQDKFFDAARWAAAQALSEVWRDRLSELRVEHVVALTVINEVGSVESESDDESILVGIRFRFRHFHSRSELHLCPLCAPGLAPHVFSSRMRYPEVCPAITQNPQQCIANSTHERRET